MDILINNAGVSNLEFGRTEDNLEVTYATNYFGHFLLTNLLLGNLKIELNLLNGFFEQY